VRGRSLLAGFLYSRLVLGVRACVAARVLDGVARASYAHGVADAFGWSGSELALTAAAAALTAAWLLALAAIRVARRPRDPAPGPPTLELAAEPPAVANLLVNGFRVTPDAVPATLLDLAARRLVEIERIDVERYQVRLRATEGEPLTPYERRVLDVLERRASGGVVPAQALTTGPGDESRRWWRRFRNEVVHEAQQRGLSRDIWDGATLRRLAVAAALPAPPVALAHGLEPAAVYAVAAFALLGWLRSVRRQRDTEAGLAAAGHWLGVRAALDEDEAFPAQPPTAVALWERLLSYGAALGVAAGAIRPIPMGAESDTRAWSSYGGRWRQVRVRYPRLFPLGWGSSPPTTALQAFAVTAGATLILVVLWSAALPFDGLEGPWLAVPVVLFGVPLVVALGGATLLVRALADLTATTEVVGEVIRRRKFGSDEKTRYYIALDDGTRDDVRAWRVGSAVYVSVEQHDVVVASVTPRLRFVRSIGPAPSRLPASSASAEPV
jgi:hypothetical protein